MSQSTDDPRLAVALLAAGSSRRFGEQDKLGADCRGKMLGLHAASAIQAGQFAKAWVIANAMDHPCAKGWEEAGFALVLNEEARDGMGTSVALAARLALECKADALMIALADMPFVPAAHFSALIEATQATDPEQMWVSCAGQARMPPAVFGSAHFQSLAACDGDEGARALLAEAAPITCLPDWLVDIDTPAALAKFS